MKRILVAEDDPSLQDIFQLLLKKKGYEVEMIYRDGLLADYCSRIDADLFLLDLHLSGYNGLDICRRLKEQDSTCRIPVIMVSANSNIQLLAERSGADAAIEKPFDTAELLETIAFHLDKGRQGLSSVA